MPGHMVISAFSYCGTDACHNIDRNKSEYPDEIELQECLEQRGREDFEEARSARFVYGVNECRAKLSADFPFSDGSAFLLLEEEALTVFDALGVAYVKCGVSEPTNYFLVYITENKDLLFEEKCYFEYVTDTCYLKDVSFRPGGLEILNEKHFLWDCKCIRFICSDAFRKSWGDRHGLYFVPLDDMERADTSEGIKLKSGLLLTYNGPRMVDDDDGGPGDGLEPESSDAAPPGVDVALVEPPEDLAELMDEARDEYAEVFALVEKGSVDEAITLLEEAASELRRCPESRRDEDWQSRIMLAGIAYGHVVACGSDADWTGVQMPDEEGENVGVYEPGKNALLLPVAFVARLVLGHEDPHGEMLLTHNLLRGKGSLPQPKGGGPAMIQ